MEESGAQTPKPNELVDPQFEAYALTSSQTWQAAEFLMTKLEPFNLEDDDPGTRLCIICQQDFSDSQDVKHTPVRAPCGHIFGKICIIKWLDPLCGWGLKADDVDAVTQSPFDRRGRTDCPICREVFFPKCMIEPMEYVAQRLSFWDMAYAAAGVARTAMEKRSRKVLWEYVEYCRSMDDHEPDGQTSFSLPQVLLLRWAKNMKSQDLTPVQERLRAKLERIGRKDLRKCAFINGSYVFDFDRHDDEGRNSEVFWHTVGG
ncbi:hypothetical protein MMC29_002216 [Sticta canariensis]|nr:hypothetical protein [Sticta canariensis]